MRYNSEGTTIFALGTTVGSGGTVTATGQAIDWSRYYEPDVRLAVSVGATPSGTVIARILGGTAAALDTAETLGDHTVTGGLAGTVSFDVTGTINSLSQYVIAQVISTGYCSSRRVLPGQAADHRLTQHLRSFPA